jgi:ribosomal protein S4
LFCRKNLISLFFNFKNIRQKKLTKKIQKKTKFFFYKNFTHDYNLVNILVKSGFFLFPRDAVIFIKSSSVYVNGVFVNSCDYSLYVGDCIQIQVFDFFYIYLLVFKKFMKYKVSNFKQSSWLFFKKNFLKKTNTVKKFKKRKKPKFLYLLYLYKFNTPQYIEVDFITLSVVLIKKLSIVKHKTYFLNKNFSWKLFQLYNFKKIN